MKNYDPNAIFAGLRKKQKLQEAEGDAFTTHNSTAELTPKPLDKTSQRMAGQMMAREMELSDPGEADRTMMWMNRFGLSNQGFEWNQGRMNINDMGGTGQIPTDDMQMQEPMEAAQ